MGAPIYLPTAQPIYRIKYTHTWNDPAGSGKGSEGLYQLLPEPLGAILDLNKIEGIYSKIYLTESTYDGGNECKVYVEGDLSKSNTSGVCGVVANLDGTYTLTWNDDRINDCTTLIEFFGYSGAGVHVPLRQAQRLVNTPRMRQRVR